MANYYVSVTAQRLKAEFIPILSPEGSDNLLIEKQLIFLWNRYLDNVEGESLYK